MPPPWLVDFAVGVDGHLYHNSWNGSNWQLPPGLDDRGGGNLVTSPSAVSWGANRLDAFAVGTDGQLYHDSWDGNRWQQALDDRGGSRNANLKLVSSPSAVSWGVDRLDVYAIDNDQDLYHNSWDGNAWQDTVGTVDDLGGGWIGSGLGPHLLYNSPSAVAWIDANGNFRNDVFAFGSGNPNHLYQKWWDGSYWRGGPDDCGVLFYLT